MVVINVGYSSQFLPPPKEKHYEWQYAGECNKYDPEIFFLPTNARDKEKQQRIREAKKICASCSVVSECLDYALTTRQKFGVWGGTSEDERRKILIRRGH